MRFGIVPQPLRQRPAATCECVPKSTTTRPARAPPPPRVLLCKQRVRFTPDTNSTPNWQRAITQLTRTLLGAANVAVAFSRISERDSVAPQFLHVRGGDRPKSYAERQQKRQAHHGTCLTFKWRRGRDSNPRTPEGVNGFRDRRIQPLCHPSVGYWLSKSGARRRHRTILAESLGFEPRIRFRRIHDFQSCSFGHSDNSPGTATASIS